MPPNGLEVQLRLPTDNVSSTNKQNPTASDAPVVQLQEISIVEWAELWL